MSLFVTDNIVWDIQLDITNTLAIIIMIKSVSEIEEKLELDNVGIMVTRLISNFANSNIYWLKQLDCVYFPFNS